MNTKPFCAVLALAAGFLLNGCQCKPAAGPGVTANDITVTFKDPEKFTDVRETMGGPTVQGYLDILADHLKKKAPAFLQTGQKLAVTFNDIDLAGDFQSGSRGDMLYVRIIKSIYRPRMDLNFEVRDSGGKVVKAGQRVVQNLTYQLDEPNPALSTEEPLYYDKLLLTRWLEEEFKP